MEQKTLSLTSLVNAINYNLPKSVKHNIDLCINEDASYAADELVELAEEILSQLAAIGFATYLKQPKQKSVYNDFLINLFTSAGHSYNAGPLYKWATNMIKEVEGDEVKSILPFFTDYKDEFIRLSSLRNEVMHGFFVLPPERNLKEAEHIAGLLEKIAEAKIFEHLKYHFHFVNKEGFNGNWSVSNDADWSLFNNCFQFEKLAERISVELSDEFIKAENEFVNSNKRTVEEVNKNAIEFISNNKKGALAFWYRPNDVNAINGYQSVVQKLQKNENLLPVFFRLQDVGLTLTSSFLLRVLGQAISTDTGNAKYQSDTDKAIKNKELISKRKKKPVVVLYGVHIGLFNDNHLLKLANTLFDAEIPMIVFGEHYTYLDRFINQSFSIHSPSYIPSESEWKSSLQNYLRFKGPSLEKSDEKEDYELLCEIMSKLTEELNEVCKTEGGNVVARRFADKYNYPIEYVHECFAILNPFLQSGKEDFIKDEVDELYGFPKVITETTAIFLSLGRRDVKLEYKHKTLSL
jgi:hypothetical protein